MKNISKKQVASAFAEKLVDHDISSRKGSEEALRESESRYHMVISNMPVVIFVTDKKGIFTLSEGKGLEKLGLQPGQVVGLSVFDVYGDYPVITEAIKNAIAGNAQREEVVVQGTVFDVIFSPMFDQHGSVVEVIGVSNDITERKRMEDALRKSESRAKATLQAIPDMMFRMNSQGVFLDYKAEFNDLYTQSDQIIGKSIQEVTPPEFAALIKEKICATLETGSMQTFEYQLPQRDLGLRQYEARMITSAADEVTAIVREVTERKQAEDQLRQLSRAVENSPAAIIITDVYGKIEYVNPKFTKLNGYTLDEMRGRIPRILKADQADSEVDPDLWPTILSGKEWHGEILNHKKGGETYWSYTSISAITDSKGSISHFVSLNEDITARRAAEDNIRLLNAELQKLALTDELTNLFNRRYFMQRGTEEFKRAHRNCRPLSVLMLDIDEFKSVNDTYGHEIGDMALKQVAVVMKSCVRDVDLLGRIGGEEFAVLLPNTSLGEAMCLAERVRQAVSDMSFAIPGTLMTVTISIGAAAFKDDMSSIDDLLRNADFALYRAKQSGRNQVMQY